MCATNLQIILRLECPQEGLTDRPTQFQKTCPICLEILGENITTTNCNHIFCNGCFDELMDNNRIECPLCRGIIKGYLNNEGRVRVLLRNNRRSNRNQNEQNEQSLTTPLMTINDIRRYRMKYYFYTLY